MSLFDINIHELGRQLLPPRLRGPKWRAWLRAMLSPVVSARIRFSAKRMEALYSLAHNGQVCKLQAVLNDTFDPDNRGIYIEDAPVKDALYLYRTAENKPKYLYRTSEGQPKYLYRTEETGAGALDFIVFVPAGVVYDEVHLRAVVNQYKLASKKFKIETVA